MGGMADHEWAADPRIRDVLAGLLGSVAAAGSAAGLDTLIAPLSGGERRRIALARLLLAASTCCCSTSRRTTSTSRASTGSHATSPPGPPCGRDARPLVPRRRLHAHLGGHRRAVQQYEGGYAAWMLARAERDRIAAATEERRRNLAPQGARLAAARAAGAHVEAAVPDRGRQRPDRRRAARPRPRRAAEVRDRPARPLRRRPRGRRRRVRRAPAAAPGDVAARPRRPRRPGRRERLREDDAAARAARPVRAGSRARCGSAPPSGRRCCPRTSRIWTATCACSSRSSRPRADRARRRARADRHQLCERFGFAGGRAWTHVRDLSGGERRRLQLMRLLMGEPNLLCWTSRATTSTSTRCSRSRTCSTRWPGTLVVVSHDRYLVERVCDDVYAIADDLPCATCPAASTSTSTSAARPPRRRRRRRRRGRPSRRAAPSCARHVATPRGWSASSSGWRRARRSCTR